MNLTVRQHFSIDYTFPVIFCRDFLRPANRLLADLLSEAGPGPHRLLACIDSGVAQSFPDLVQRLVEYTGSHASIVELAAEPTVLRGGENCKNDPTLLPRLHELIAHHHLCRQSFILAIGGGGILDAVGFAAATAHRGVRLIRVPTTVLAQNDAGVGVKNSVNFRGRKNFLGTFAPPFAVINDFAFLTTLPERQLRAGIVEAVKVALIKDSDFFKELCTCRRQLAAFTSEAMERMIRRCAELHIEHIGRSGDPFESGSSRPLDFGHWSAHKLEELTAGELNHGEAVAVGIGLDTIYSRESGLLPPATAEAILTLLEDLGLVIYHPTLKRLDIVTALAEFREHLGGVLTIPMLSGPGQLREVHAIDCELMQSCIVSLSERDARSVAEPLRCASGS